MSSVSKKGSPQKDSEEGSGDCKNVVLRLEVQNLKVINSSLKEKIVELNQRARMCEEIFAKFNSQYAALFEGRPVDDSVVVRKDLLDDLRRMAEEYRSMQGTQVRVDAELHLKLEEREREVAEAKERVKELEEVLERQSAAYEALVKGNEMVVGDIHRQFEAYNEIASKESLQLKQLLEEKNMTVDARTQELMQTIEKLKSENKKLLGDMEQMKTEAGELKLQLENKAMQLENLTEQHDALKRDKEGPSAAEKREESADPKTVQDLSGRIHQLQADLAKLTEENKTLQEQVKAHSEIAGKQRANLEAQAKCFKEREADLTKQVNDLQGSLKELTSAGVEKSGIGDSSMLQTEERLKIEQLRSERFALKADNESLLKENVDMKKELAELKLNLEKCKEDALKFRATFEQLEKSKKDSVELLEQLEKLHGENIELRNSSALSSKELTVTRFSLEEAEFRLKAVTERPGSEEAKDGVNVTLKKLTDLVRKAKTMIASRNAFIDILKKDNESLRGELESKKAEGLIAKKRKKHE